MKSKNLLIAVMVLSLQIVFRPGNSNAQWVQSLPIFGGAFYALSYNGNNLIAAADAGIFYSSNYGVNWISAGYNQTVLSLTTSGSETFAGVLSYGVFKSVNGGMNWVQTGYTASSVNAIVKDSSYIFAGIPSYGVQISSNNGVTWYQSSLNYKDIFSLAISGNNVFAGTKDSGVYISSNNGYTWQRTSNQLNGKRAMCLAVYGNTIFAGTYGQGVYYSSNNGTNWSQTSMNDQYVHALLHNNVVVFAGTTTGVYSTTNNGTNWLNRNQGFHSGGAGIRSLLIRDIYIYAGTHSQSIWRRLYNDIININQISTEIPLEYSLGQNYPNPFNASTVIQFAVAAETNVELKVYDVQGREVNTLVNERMNPGRYETRFNAADLPSGVYFYTLRANGKNYSSKRMTMIK